MKFKLIYIFSGILVLWLAGCAENVSAEGVARNARTDISILSDTIPTPIGFVNDFDDLFTDAEEQYLDSLIIKLEKETAIECVLITVPSDMTTIDDFDRFILATARTWGVGKEKNNGIVIGFSKTHKKIRIENGRGIEPILTNHETQLAIDSIFIPAYKNERYFQGTAEGMIYLFKKLRERV